MHKVRVTAYTVYTDTYGSFLPTDEISYSYEGQLLAILSHNDSIYYVIGKEESGMICEERLSAWREIILL